MSGVVNESVECSSCGFVFHGGEVGEHPGEHEPCPSCGSLMRNIRLTIKETLGLSEYIGIKAKKQSSKHKKNRVDYVFEEGKKKGKDGEMVYKKRVINREQPDLLGSYIELVRDKDNNIIVNKNEKLSEHRKA